MTDLMIRPTEIELVQPSSKSATDSKAKPFTLRDKETGKHYKRLKVHMVRIQKHRVFWGSAKFGETPECSTHDGMVPLPTSPKPVCPSCLLCPNAVWVNGQRSACREKRILYFTADETEGYHWMVLPGTSVTTVDRWDDARRKDILFAKLKNKVTMKLWDFRTELVPIRGKDGGPHGVISFEKTVRVKEPGSLDEIFTVLPTMLLPATTQAAA